MGQVLAIGQGVRGERKSWTIGWGVSREGQVLAYGKRGEEFLSQQEILKAVSLYHIGVAAILPFLCTGVPFYRIVQ